MGTKLKILIITIFFLASFKVANAAITIRPALVFSTGGSIIISSSKNINTDTLAAGRSCADGGDGVAYSVTALTSNTATLSVSPAAGCLSANDRIMLINLQADGTNLTNVGNYEFLIISSVVTNTVTFTVNKTKYYGNGAADDTNIGTTTTKQRVILQRVPQYYNVTIQNGGTLTASGWDGVRGGVLAFYASGNIIVQGGGSIDMSAKGYRSTSTHSSQGESYNGVGAMLQTANLGGGGGDINADDAECHYDRNGAGGGGFGTLGSNEGWQGYAKGGAVYGSADLSKLFFGSGGGSTAHMGGRGGGIIYVKANSVSLAGSVLNNGETTTAISFGGGAGAGGSIYLSGNMLDIGANKLTASGGAGDQDVDTYCDIRSGDGGAGRIHLKSSNISGTTNPAAVTSSLPTAKTLAPNNNGLVGYWSFEEGMGTKAGDMSGRGNNGTLSGGPEWINGKRGKALNFPNTGGDDWVDLGTNFNISSVPFTISAWINPADYANYNTIIGKRDGWASNNMRFQFQLNSSDGRARLDGSPSNMHDFGYSPPINTWTLLTAVATAGYTDLYVNGVIEYNSDGFVLGTDSTAQAAIGRNGEPGDPDPFRGKLDEVRIYNRALSATEVASLYQSSGRKTTINSSQNSQLTTGLVGLWSFNGADISGSLALDRSGLGNNGTITGAVPTIGKAGQALKFNGAGDYLSVNDSSSLNTATSVTISLFAKGSMLYNDYLFSKFSSSSIRLYSYITALNGPIAVVVRDDTPFPNERVQSTTNLAANTWYHIVFTADGTNMKLYINGSLEDTRSLNYAFSEQTGNNLQIGGYSPWGLYWHGSIDEVRIYNRALSAGEIQRLYNMGR